MKSYLLFSLIALLSFSCVNSTQEHSNKKTTIVCTTNIVGDLVKSMVPDDFIVVNLMGAGVDPHIYKPKPGDIDALQNADYIIYNGLHLEGKMGEILESFGKLKKVYALSDALRSEQLIRAESFAAGVDPHIWFDPDMWLQCGIKVAEVLKSTYPSHAEEIEGKKNLFKSSILGLKTEIDSLITRIPEKKRVLVTAHDAFSYFARRYNFDLITIQGLSTQTDFSIKTIENISDNMLAKQVSCAFFESSIPKKSVETLIKVCAQKGLEVKEGGVLFSDALGNFEGPASNYQKMFLYNIHEISACLSQ